jgi:hypothetical protein
MAFFKDHVERLAKDYPPFNYAEEVLNQLIQPRQRAHLTPVSAPEPDSHQFSKLASVRSLLLRPSAALTSHDSA